MSRTRLLRAALRAALTAAPAAAAAQTSLLPPPAFTAFGDSTRADLQLPPISQCTPISKITIHGPTLVDSGCGFLTGTAHGPTTVTFDEFARVQFGQPIRLIHSTSAVDMAATGARAFFAALLGDVLTFREPGPMPAFVDIELHETGTIGTTGSAAASAELESCLGATSEVPIRVLDACEPGTAFAPLVSHRYDGGTVDETYTTTFGVSSDPDIAGVSWVAFFYALRGASSLALVPPNPRLDGSAKIDFSHSGTILGIRARDAAGHDITSQVSVSSASGVTYALLPSAVVSPEPATLALLATGLAALGGVATGRARLGLSAPRSRARR